MGALIGRYVAENLSIDRQYAANLEMLVTRSSSLGVSIHQSTRRSNSF